jgi:ectoine hydroxylase-related dioxygenase (phytanoyl-CoA dioxygenase family)
MILKEVVHLSNEDSMNNAGHFSIPYEILSQQPEKVIRNVNVQATREEIQQFSKEGYLVREQLFQGEELEKLRNALGKLEQEQRSVSEFGQLFSTNSTYGGLFLRRLPDKEQEFLDLVYDQRLLSVARAMMGPQLMVSTMARITFPGEPNQETQWHQHLRHMPIPLPPWFVRPHSIDILIYLDDIDQETGPICVVPGSHDRLDIEPAPEYYGEYPNQLTLTPKAGTALFIHSNLWHRAMPTTPQGRKRRLVLVCYHPTWFKRRWSDAGDGLIKTALESGDEETRELFGLSGYM